MKKTIKAISLALCLVSVLCACGNVKKKDDVNNEVLAGQTSGASQNATDETSFEEWQSMSMAMAVIEDPSEEREGCYPIWEEDINFEWNGAVYESVKMYGDKTNRLKRITSDQEQIEILSYTPQNEVLTAYYDSITLDCPNLKEVIIGSGYETFNIVQEESDLYRSEVLHLPSDFMFFEYIEDGTYYTADTARGASLIAFPKGFSFLREIHVADNVRLEASIWSAEGMLYTRRTFGTNRQSSLVCIPQNYQTEDGTVTLPQQATIIQTHAVYQCRNIKRLVIPESTKLLENDAIIATSENPLTIVCAPGSAADEYVRLYGEQYHLTVEYFDIIEVVD